MQSFYGLAWRVSTRDLFLRCRNSFLSRLLLGVFACLAITPPAVAQNQAPPPVRVFILAGQSNMVGKAPLTLLDHQITAPDTADFFAHLHVDGAYIVREDVWIDTLGRRGGLTPGYGSRDRFGVELEFGNLMGDHFEEPVLLIKAAWGGKSLARDFRPPSAGLPTDEALQAILDRENEGHRNHNRDAITMDDLKARYGHFYREMMAHIRDTLAEMGERFPELEGRDYDLSGFVWFQGWNDQYNDYEREYESNLAHFIRDVREELDAPKLPFVIGVMGQNGSNEATGAMLTIQTAQEAMQNMPEFAGNVTAVQTDELIDVAAETLYPEWRERPEEWARVGGDQMYHYLGSAIWFSRMGTAFGEAMIELMGTDQ